MLERKSRVSILHAGRRGVSGAANVKVSILSPGAVRSMDPTVNLNDKYTKFPRPL